MDPKKHFDVEAKKGCCVDICSFLKEFIWKVFTWCCSFIWLIGFAAAFGIFLANITQVGRKPSPFDDNVWERGVLTCMRCLGHRSYR